jgi:hypothetical protein
MLADWPSYVTFGSTEMMLGYWICAFAGIAAYAAVHEGVARRLAGGVGDAAARRLIVSGALTLGIGAGFWLSEAWGLQRLVDRLSASLAFSPQREITADELASIPAERRPETTRRWAQNAFVNGGSLMNVVQEDGHLSPYKPTTEDVHARDKLSATKRELDTQISVFATKAAQMQTEGWRWILALMVAFVTGTLAGRARRPESRSLPL